MTRTKDQGDVDFSIAYKVQKTWGNQEAVTFSLEGIGATLVFAGLAADEPSAAICGISVLLASGMLLLAHLGAPRNIIYLLANIRHSWMSRGAALIPLYIFLVAILLILRWAFDVSLDGAFRWGLLGLMALLTIFVLLKSGLVMTTFPAIPFWTGGFLPALFALNGMATGLGIYPVVTGNLLMAVVWLPPLLNLALLVGILVYLSTMRTAGSAAKVSVRLIWQRHALLFWGAGIGLGTVVPMMAGIVDVFAGATGATAFVIAVAVLRIGGDIAIRSVVLKVGVYEKMR